MPSPITHLALLASLAANSFASALCKNHPSSPHWPSESEWHSLNQSTQGALLAGLAPASSCYEGNPLGSDIDCDTVQKNWFLSQFHAEQPASIGYSYWANSSCVAPNDYAYDNHKPCQLGGLPQYVLNATDAGHVATAMAWANSRDIRVVIKGTGHDLNGRSSGAYALSIWTHHLQDIGFDPRWIRPAFNSTENVVIAQTGNTWGRLLKAASEVNRTVVSGQDGTVGLGGFIGGGGHGPLSSSYGLSADQILQATVVTTDGSILIANDEQNQDLLWAIRGGGPGSYGVVIEYVMRTFPLPSNVVVGSLSMSAQEASWDGLSTLMRALPDLMDSGLTGFGIGTVSQSKPSSTSAVGRQVDISMLFYLFNSTTAEWTSLLSPLQQEMAAVSNNHSIQVTLSEPKILPHYLDLFDVLNPTASSCGDISLSSSRLLGRRELTDIGHDAVKGYLKRITTAQIEGHSTRLVIGLQGGQGPRNVEDSMRGGLTSAWRDAYLHVLVTGSSIETENTSPRSALQAAADWTNAHKETVWAEWAPDSGSYINEANPFNPNFQRDFYGDHYGQLLSIKGKYDPRSILYVQSGVGSQDWEYNLQDGKLCRK